MTNPAPAPAAAPTMPVLPNPSGVNIQGMVTPPDGAGRSYVVIRFTDATACVSGEVRLTTEMARKIAPDLGKMLATLAEQAEGLMRQAGLLVSPGLVLPGNPGFMPPQGG